MPSSAPPSASRRPARCPRSRRRAASASETIPFFSSSGGLLGEERRDLLGQRLRRPRAEQRARPRSSGRPRPRALGRLEVDLAERPAVQPVVHRQLELPLEVQRHPRLAPVGHPDRGRHPPVDHRPGVEQRGVPPRQRAVQRQVALGAQPVQDGGRRQVAGRRRGRDQVVEVLPVAQRRLPDQLVGLVRDAAVLQAPADQVGAVQQALVAGRDLVGEPAGERLVGLEPAVVPVSQRAVEPGGEHGRVGREVPAGQGPAHGDETQRVGLRDAARPGGALEDAGHDRRVALDQLEADPAAHQLPGRLLDERGRHGRVPRQRPEVPERRLEVPTAPGDDRAGGRRRRRSQPGERIAHPDALLGVAAGQAQERPALHLLLERHQAVRAAEVGQHLVAERAEQPLGRGVPAQPGAQQGGHRLHAGGADGDRDVLRARPRVAARAVGPHPVHGAVVERLARPGRRLLHAHPPPRRGDLRRADRAGGGDPLAGDPGHRGDRARLGRRRVEALGGRRLGADLGTRERLRQQPLVDAPVQVGQPPGERGEVARAADRVELGARVPADHDVAQGGAGIDPVEVVVHREAVLDVVEDRGPGRVAAGHRGQGGRVERRGGAVGDARGLLPVGEPHPPAAVGLDHPGGQGAGGPVAEPDDQPAIGQRRLVEPAVRGGGVGHGAGGEPVGQRPVQVDARRPVRRVGERLRGPLRSAVNVSSGDSGARSSRTAMSARARRRRAGRPAPPRPPAPGAAGRGAGRGSRSWRRPRTARSGPRPRIAAGRPGPWGRCPSQPRNQVRISPTAITVCRKSGISPGASPNHCW